MGFIQSDDAAKFFGMSKKKKKKGRGIDPFNKPLDM